MTAPGGDSGENPPGNADRPWADAGKPSPDQGGWAYPSGPSSFDPYPPPGFPPPPPSPGGYPPPPAPGGYGPPPGYGPPADYPGYPTPSGPPPGYPPAGYGTPPGYPPAGPGTPYPGGYFNPGQVQKTNSLAICSLVVSLLGLLPSLVFWPLSVVGPILGIVALSQIKRTGEAGRGMAVAGTAVGGATLALSFILMLATLH